MAVHRREGTSAQSVSTKPAEFAAASGRLQRAKASAFPHSMKTTATVFTFAAAPTLGRVGMAATFRGERFAYDGGARVLRRERERVAAGAGRPPCGRGASSRRPPPP